MSPSPKDKKRVKKLVEDVRWKALHEIGIANIDEQDIPMDTLSIKDQAIADFLIKEGEIPTVEEWISDCVKFFQELDSIFLGTGKEDQRFAPEPLDNKMRFFYLSN